MNAQAYLRQKSLKNAINVSTEWAKRSKIEFGSDKSKGLFGIAQGGLDKDLGIEGITKLKEIGSMVMLWRSSRWRKSMDMFEILNETTGYLPKQKPRYLMGVGTPSDILGAVNEGIDMFDCVMPTRSGRTGLAFTWEGKLNLKNSKFQNDNPRWMRNAT